MNLTTKLTFTLLFSLGLFILLLIETGWLALIIMPVAALFIWLAVRPISTAEDVEFPLTHPTGD